MRITFALCLLVLAALCSASALPYANAYARALDKRNATPVVVARGAPSPSPSPRPHADDRVRESKVPTRKHQTRQLDAEVLLSPAELSQHLCPEPMSVCLITSSASPTTLSEWTRDGFECVDTQEDLTSCGGCGILDQKYDCTAIEGSRTVSCVVGTCQIDSCRSGYTLALDGKSCLRTE